MSVKAFADRFIASRSGVFDEPAMLRRLFFARGSGVTKIFTVISSRLREEVTGGLTDPMIERRAVLSRIVGCISALFLSEAGNPSTSSDGSTSGMHWFLLISGTYISLIQGESILSTYCKVM